MDQPAVAAIPSMVLVFEPEFSAGVAPTLVQATLVPVARAQAVPCLT